MKIRTITAATCAALAFSMAGPIYAHDGMLELEQRGRPRCAVTSAHDDGAPARCAALALAARRST